MCGWRGSVQTSASASRSRAEQRQRSTSSLCAFFVFKREWTQRQVSMSRFEWQAFSREGLAAAERNWKRGLAVTTLARAEGLILIGGSTHRKQKTRTRQGEGLPEVARVRFRRGTEQSCSVELSLQRPQGAKPKKHTSRSTSRRETVQGRGEKEAWTTQARAHGVVAHDARPRTRHVGEEQQTHRRATHVHARLIDSRQRQRSRRERARARSEDQGVRGRLKSSTCGSGRWIM